MEGAGERSAVLMSKLRWGRYRLFPDGAGMRSVRQRGHALAAKALQALLSESEDNEELLHDYVSGIGYR